MLEHILNDLAKPFKPYYWIYFYTTVKLSATVFPSSYPPFSFTPAFFSSSDIPFPSSLPLPIYSSSLLPSMHCRLSRLSCAIKRHWMGEGGLPCSRNCAEYTHGNPGKGSPLCRGIWSHSVEERSVQRTKGSVKEDRAGIVCVTTVILLWDVVPNGDDGDWRQAEWAELFMGMENENNWGWVCSYHLPFEVYRHFVNHFKLAFLENCMFL